MQFNVHAGLGALHARVRRDRCNFEVWKRQHNDGGMEKTRPASGTNAAHLDCLTPLFTSSTLSRRNGPLLPSQASLLPPSSACRPPSLPPPPMSLWAIPTGSTGPSCAPKPIFSWRGQEERRGEREQGVVWGTRHVGAPLWGLGTLFGAFQLPCRQCFARPQAHVGADLLRAGQVDALLAADGAREEHAEQQVAACRGTASEGVGSAFQIFWE